MNTPTQKLAGMMAAICAGIIVLMPLHAFLTVWLASAVGGYTALRLWKEVLLLALFVGAVTVYIRDARIRGAVNRDTLFRLIAVYLLLLVVVGGISFLAGGVSIKAYLFGLILDSRFLVFFAITWLATRYNDVIVRLWQRLLLIPAAVVVGFATLQYSLLPADFLKHFGYGPGTISPSITIDQKDAYARIQSTLRGPNPFGAYMVLILSALGNLLLWTKKLRIWHGIFFVLGGMALAFTFSRSAWLGTLASILILIWWGITSRRIRKYLVVAAFAAVLVFGMTAYTLRDNDHFQNVFFHTNEHSQSAESSNTGHFNAVQQGIKDIVQAPWGSGTGTAGPASVYNDGKARIAENYYVQIGQEVGIVGLVLFIAINVLVLMRLWAVRRTTVLARVLMASFAGITIISLLMHAWTDDTLAYIWWGFAGAAIAAKSSKH